MTESSLTEFIQASLGEQSRIKSILPASGGCINKASIVTLQDKRKLFIKQKPASQWPGMYEAEFNILRLLQATGTFHIPTPIACNASFLLLDCFEEAQPAADWQQQFGTNLALMHKATQYQQFGYEMDSYLGANEQINSWQSDWLTFWRDQRLAPQLDMASRLLPTTDKLLAKGNQLLGHLDELIGEIYEPAVLLHGDLWSGNTSATGSGEPVIFDPAGYYGHREAEFGIMCMFGGFDARCEQAYNEVWPVQEGFAQRMKLYRLYHELNHFNLFGTAYYECSLNSVESLL